MRYFLFVTFLLSISALTAQRLKNSVINSCGNQNYFSSSAITLKTSIGEPIVGKLVSTHATVQQGFLYSVRSHPGSLGVTNPAYLYPNPTRGILNFKEPIPGASVVEFINTMGQYRAIKKINMNRIEINDLPRGFYAVRILNDKGQLLFKSSIIKL